MSYLVVDDVVVVVFWGGFVFFVFAVVIVQIMGIIDVAKHCRCYAMEVVGNQPLQSMGETVVLRRPGRVFFPSSGNNHNFRNGITLQLKSIFLQR